MKNNTLYKVDGLRLALSVIREVKGFKLWPQLDIPEHVGQKGTRQKAGEAFITNGESPHRILIASYTALCI